MPTPKKLHSACNKRSFWRSVLWHREIPGCMYKFNMDSLKDLNFSNWNSEQFYFQFIVMKGIRNIVDYLHLGTHFANVMD